MTFFLQQYEVSLIKSSSEVLHRRWLSTFCMQDLGSSVKRNVKIPFSRNFLVYSNYLASNVRSAMSNLNMCVFHFAVVLA